MINSGKEWNWMDDKSQQIINKINKEENMKPSLTQQLIEDARDIMESFDISPAMTIGFDKDEYILTPKQMSIIANALYLADCEISVQKIIDKGTELIEQNEIRNKKEVIKVPIKNRHNPLAEKPTNNTVKVVYRNHVTEYDNIHYPQAFITKIQRNKENNDWTEIWLNDDRIKINESKDLPF